MKPAPSSGTSESFRGYLIISNGFGDRGFRIEKSGHVIQHFAATIEAAKGIIRQLTD